MGRIVIVGSGIIGLYTAFLLSERGMAKDTTVIAKHMPGDYSIEYTSPIAGAHFSVEFGAKSARMARFCRLSYEMLKKFFAKFEGQLEEAGLAQNIPQIEFEAEPMDPELVKSFQYVDGYERITDKAELAKRGAVDGQRYLTFNFYTPKLLAFLKKYLEEQGVTFKRAELERLADAPKVASVPAPAAIFNCTGVNAPKLKDLGDTHKNFPIRGQVVAVRAPWIDANYGLYEAGKPPTYVIPRFYSGGRVILGGYFEDNDGTEGTNSEQTKSIIERTTKLVPELLKEGPLEILDERAGLRPGRDGDARIEKVFINGIPVIHNYGAAGAGYQCGLAMAQDALDLYFGDKAKL